jgi:hypothetical protein
MFGNVEYRKVMEGGSGQVVLSLIAKISKVGGIHFSNPLGLDSGKFRILWFFDLGLRAS